MVQTLAQRHASLKNLKHARAMKKAMRRVGMGMVRRNVKKGGFSPFAALGALEGAHKVAQKVKPITALRDVGKALGLSLPGGKVGNFIGKVGNYAINKLGYGRRINRGKYRKSRGGEYRRILSLVG